MPLYEYQCDACGARFELIRKFSDPPLEVCQSCGKGPVQKLVSSPAFQFKGSGWYITDYARKSDGAESKGESKPASASTDKGSSSSSDSATTKPSESSDKPAVATPTKDS
jgi:putative FmdB family regulatory protein